RMKKKELKNNKKKYPLAFTLLELLVIIAVLGILLVVTMPNVFNMIRNAKVNSYNTLVESFENNARLYVDKNKETIEPLILRDGFFEITLQELSDEGLLKEDLVNPKTNETIPLTKKVLVISDKN